MRCKHSSKNRSPPLGGRSYVPVPRSGARTSGAARGWGRRCPAPARIHAASATTRRSSPPTPAALAPHGVKSATRRTVLGMRRAPGRGHCRQDRISMLAKFEARRTHAARSYAPGCVSAQVGHSQCQSTRPSTATQVRSDHLEPRLSSAYSAKTRSIAIAEEDGSVASGCGQEQVHQSGAAFRNGNLYPHLLRLTICRIPTCRHKDPKITH